jgi:uncharacterized protein YjbI with pentapeptide repeats
MDNATMDNARMDNARMDNATMHNATMHNATMHNATIYKKHLASEIYILEFDSHAYAQRAFLRAVGLFYDTGKL